MSCERETDRLEIIEMTRELTQERKKREMDRRLMDDLKQQVKYIPHKAEVPPIYLLIKHLHSIGSKYFSRYL